MIACDLVLPRRYAFFLGLPKIDPVNSVFRALPACFAVNFSGLRHITIKILLQLHLTLRGVE